MCYLDLDDSPRLPSPPPPAAPSWEKLGEPMVLQLGDRDVVITAAMLRAAAETFSAEVPVEPVDATFTLASGGRIGPDPLRCWGWIERVEMRGDALWGFVRWTAQRPLYGVSAVLDFGTDLLTGVPRLRGAVIRPAIPGMAPVAA